MEDNLKSEEIQKLNDRFKRLMEAEHKAKNFNSFKFFNDSNSDYINELSRTIEKKSQEFCKRQYEGLLAYSKKFDEDNKIISPEVGYEKEFNEAEDSLKKCIGKFDFYRNGLEYDVELLRQFTSDSYNLCLESCKHEFVSKKLNENIIKSCLNGCYRYLLINKEIFNEMMADRFVTLKDEIKNKTSF